ncbi:restriction endonuclease [Leeia sp. TBRC 13508]|uniref:Restriction endonuclease n=1 Tax=Leeia speluncae TaxID=2884804 RepID=A0ABS8D6N5_9NEIS|nr:restriction endonuclease [Leeia speluncae]MCB6183863.1 restriction endonuclease [Leeia speluncae]
MWQFAGAIRYLCNECDEYGHTDISDFEVENVDCTERAMGAELTYELTLDEVCSNCGYSIEFNFMVYVYPEGCINYVESNIQGASTTDTPVFEYFPELYEAREFDLAIASTKEIILEIQSDPELIRNINSRQFEEVVAELFRNKGFQVELTKRTRDGGKDIIAISTDRFGIPLKYFIECKHYAETNTVGVDVVRALHGVKNTKDGPNKTIIATTSSFSTDAIRFVEKEASSSWDISLADYNQIVTWIDDYNSPH